MPDVCSRRQQDHIRQPAIAQEYPTPLEMLFRELLFSAGHSFHGRLLQTPYLKHQDQDKGIYQPRQFVYQLSTGILHLFYAAAPYLLWLLLWLTK